jgi:PAS domain S-box-containing protein
MPPSDIAGDAPAAANPPGPTDSSAFTSADTLLQTMPWGVLALAPDGTVAMLNPAAEALWGVPTAAVLGRTPAQVQPAVLPPELLQALVQQPESELAATYWLPHTRQWISMRIAPAPDGRRWVCWDNITASQQARPTAHQHQASDLLAATGNHERQLMHAALREAEERYRLLFEGISQGFCVIEILFNDAQQPVDYRFLVTNPAFEEQTGMCDVVGQTMGTLRPGHETHWFELYAQVLRTGEAQRFARVSERLGRFYEVYAFRVGDPGAYKVAVLFSDISGRQRTEAALRESEESYRMLFNSIDEGYFLCDVLFDEQGAPVDMLYVDANPAATRMVGADYRGKRLREMDPAYESYWFEIFGRVARTGVGERLERYAAPDQKWYSFYISKIGDDASRRVAVVFQDITARKQAEAALHESEQQFRLMADAVPQIVWLTDTEGRVEFFNQQWSDYTGVPYEPTTAAEVAASFVHPDDGAHTMAAFTAARATGTTFLVEHRIRSKAGNYRWFLVRAEPYRDVKTGEISRWFGASVDIHDRKQAEVALGRAHERLQLAMNTGRIFSFEMNPATRALELSDNVELVLGFPLPDHIDSTFELIHPDDLQPTVALINGAIDSRGSYASEYRLVNPANGEVVWFHSQAAFTRINDSGEWRFVGIAQNITERKRAEEVVQQSEARQAYLLALSDALRSVSDAVEMQGAAAHTTMHYFGAHRCYYCEIAGDTVTIRRDAARPGLPSVAAVYSLSTMPIFQAMLRESQPVVVADVRTSTVMDDNLKQLCLGFGIIAYINVPIIKNGEQVGMLCLTQGTPREWTALETSLVQETAERTWTAVERAQTEEALRHSEARFRSLFESMSQGFAVCELVRDAAGRPIDYQMLDINPAGVQLTGIARADFIGRRVRELMPNMEMWWIETFAHVVETGETSRFEHYFPLLDRWHDFTVFAYGDDRFAFIYDDITARKQAEQAEAVTKVWLEEQVVRRTQALQASHARLSTIFEAVPLQLGYYEAVRDPDGQLVDLRAVLVNQASSNTMDLPDEASGLLMSNQVPGLRELPVWQTITQVIETGQPQRLELSHDFADTTVYFYVLYTRLDDGIISASLDITARKQMEQELRDSQQLMQSVFDTSLISMSVQRAVRDADGTIQDFHIIIANKELEKETGRTDLVGKLYAQEYPGIKLTGLYDLMLGVMATGEPAGLEYFYPHEGFNKWYACQFVKMDDGLVASNLDITERKLAELEQAKSYQLLRQSEEVASLGSWEYNRATGEFLWSAGMYRLFDLPPASSIQPVTYLHFAVPDDRAVAERIVEGLTTGRTGFEETLRIQVSGIIKTLRVKADVVLDAAGEPLRVLGVDLDISEVQRLEAENLRLRLTQQQALFRAVLEAQETERRRIAESLHNGLGQTLYAAKLQLNQLLASPAPAALNRADRLLADAIRQTRTLSHELVPSVLTEFGLLAALRDISRSLRGPNLRFACTVELDEQQTLPLPLQVAVYRMAQELAQNVVKHAHATEASLALETVPGFVLLRVEDNGVGFANPSVPGPGIGLRTIRDQVALLGGTVDLGSSPEFGTYVRIRFPLPTSAPSAA